MPKGIPTTGKRKPGAGRPSGPKTNTLSYRVPVSHIARIDLAIKRVIKEVLGKCECDICKNPESFSEIMDKKRFPEITDFDGHAPKPWIFHKD